MKAFDIAARLRGEDKYRTTCRDDILLKCDFIPGWSSRPSRDMHADRLVRDAQYRILVSNYGGFYNPRELVHSLHGILKGPLPPQFTKNHLQTTTFEEIIKGLELYQNEVVAKYRGIPDMNPLAEFTLTNMNLDYMVYIYMLQFYIPGPDSTEKEELAENERMFRSIHRLVQVLPPGRIGPNNENNDILLMAMSFIKNILQQTNWIYKVKDNILLALMLWIFAYRKQDITGDNELDMDMNDPRKTYQEAIIGAIPTSWHFSKFFRKCIYPRIDRPLDQDDLDDDDDPKV